MKKLILTLLSIAAIAALTGCSQQSDTAQSDVESLLPTDTLSSEMESSQIEETDSQAVAEENETPDNATANTPDENNQTTAEPPKQTNNVTTPQNNNTPPANNQNTTPPQHHQPVAETPPAAETPPVVETPPVAETPPSPPPVTVSGEAGQVFQLVNQRRRENGLAELSYRSDLQNAANVRANEIISTFSHTRPDGSSCFTAVNVSYRTVGENIASGQKSASAVMDSWMNSPGHRANILNSNFTGIAVGVVEYEGTKHWVQIFIG